MKSISDINIVGFFRDSTAEANVIIASRVELALRNAVESSMIVKFTGGTYDGSSLILQQGQLQVNCQVPFLPSHGDAGCYPWLLRHSCWGAINANMEPGFQTRFFFLRLTNLSSTPFPSGALLLSDLTAADMTQARQIAEELGMDGAWPEGGDSMQRQGSWRRACEGQSAISWSTRMQCQCASQAVAYTVEYLGWPVPMLLPVANFQHSSFPQPLQLHIPAKAPFHVMGENELTIYPNASVILTDEVGVYRNNLSNHEQVFCFLPSDDCVDELEITPLHGREVIWLLLDSPGSSEDSLRKMRLGVKIAERLQGHGITLRFASFSDFNWNSDFSREAYRYIGSFSEETTISQKEFLEMSTRLGVYVPRSMVDERINILSGDILEKKKRPPFLIDPIAREGAGVIIYGGPGVAKSWLAISLANALSNGTAVFPDRWKPTTAKGRKCLTIAGEMSEGEYGERLKRLNDYYVKEEGNKKNFIFHAPEQLDLASEQGSVRLLQIIDDAEKDRGIPGDPVAMVIFDNLTTLSSEGENPSRFSRIEFTMRMLKSRGITVILIHHESKQGDIRGARKISDVMDTKLHLYAADRTDDRIGVIIKNEKIRSGKHSEFETFKALLDVELAGSGWCIEPLTQAELERVDEADDDYDAEDCQPQNPPKKVAKTLYKQPAWKVMTGEERCMAIREEVNRGCTNEQIAANHATSRSTITKFRGDNQLRDQDLQVERQGRLNP